MSQTYTLTTCPILRLTVGSVQGFQAGRCLGDSVRTNHRRGFVEKGGYHFNVIRQRLFKLGLGADHDNGHRGAAKDVREAKRSRARRDRHLANAEVERNDNVTTGRGGYK